MKQPLWFVVEVKQTLEGAHICTKCPKLSKLPKKRKPIHGFCSSFSDMLHLNFSPKQINLFGCSLKTANVELFQSWVQVSSSLRCFWAHGTILFGPWDQMCTNVAPPPLPPRVYTGRISRISGVRATLEHMGCWVFFVYIKNELERLQIKRQNKNQTPLVWVLFLI